MSSDLDHWNINATVFNDRVEEIHFVNDTEKNIRRQQQKRTWHFRESLGRGGFGQVRLQVLQRNTDANENGKASYRAVKQITMSSNMPSKSECMKELEALLEFSKPRFKDAGCFVEFYGWFTDGPQMFLAMEFVGLGDLEKNVNKHSGKLPDLEAREITAQILAALEIMHAVKFAHRDLKPQNVMVVSGPPRWWIKLADFGLSKRLTDATGYHTRSGTPSYMAPEMLNYLESDTSDSDYTNAVDVWATGCIAYRLVTGVVPFPPGTSLMKYCEDKSLFPCSRLNDNGRNGIKSGVVSFLQDLLATSPGERPSASQALQHVWIKRESNTVKQYSQILQPHEVATANFAELTMSQTKDNNAARYGSKAQVDAPSAPELSYLQSSSEFSPYVTQSAYSPRPPTVIQSPPVPRDETQQRLVATRLSSKRNRASIGNKALGHEETSSKRQEIPGIEKSDSGISTYLVGKQKVQIPQMVPATKVSVEHLASYTSINSKFLRAVEERNMTLILELLVEGADVQYTGEHDFTPLHFAIIRGYEDIVHLLIDRGASVKTPTDEQTGGYRPLFIASEYGYLAIVQLLLDNGADIESVNISGSRPLHIASFRGHSAVVDFLLDKGANTEAATTHQETPLHLASRAGHRRVVHLLLDKGAYIEASGDFKAKPLHLASIAGHQAMVQLLLDRRANIEAMNEDMATPLQNAAREGNLAIIQLLLDEGANIEAIGLDKLTPLGWAKSEGHSDAVKLLLSRGADKNYFRPRDRHYWKRQR